ncbi:MAG: lytic murein transglycosylase [Mesorhizobium sp.]|nr:MAG: lytic murein transglycosylase [Mesorhizobium sp.]RWN78264.1 MAG: lytic murein transglycosylase [Mesorhizobium sp.]RWN82194.1 MAG: lytic murein transglycosylase [Mesorhizobium sp.]RWN91655.1 MAG: lytic murein transglycosylase [Mesorhizobium sp.]RWO02484.1 MAG: lytic murein transglycosylase [Mesorhizobium sp.]
MGPSTPLWPAGHLPLKGGDLPSRLISPISTAAGWAMRPELPISPLEGEMSGRTEGGERRHRVVSHP